jgi:hypothetical protein
VGVSGYGIFRSYYCQCLTNRYRLPYMAARQGDSGGTQ